MVSPSAPGVPLVGTAVVAIEPGHERHECRGQHLDRVARERHVLAIRELRADAHPGDALRQRDAVDVDVVAVRAVVEAELAEFLQVGDRRGVGVDEAERAAGQRHAAARRADCGRHRSDARRRHRLRKDVGRVAVVEAERAVEPVRAPARRNAPVAEAAGVRRRLDVLPAPQAQVRRRAGNRRGERIGSEDERVAAEVERVLDRQVAARFRNAIGLPVVEPLPGDRQVLERLRLQRDAAARQEQLLRFASRSRKALPDVERVLRVRDAVDRAAEQQAVAPVHGVLAGLDVDRHVADVEIGEHERVEQFARDALGVALRVVAQRRRQRAGR